MQNKVRMQFLLTFLLSGFALVTFTLFNHHMDFYGWLTFLLFLCCVVCMHFISNNKVTLKLVTAGSFLSIILMFIFGIKGCKMYADICNLLILFFLCLYLFLCLRYRKNRGKARK